MSDAAPVCVIRCPYCHGVFLSPRSFDSAAAFLASSLAGQIVRCLGCGGPVRCTPELMMFPNGAGHAQRPARVHGLTIPCRS